MRALSVGLVLLESVSLGRMEIPRRASLGMWSCVPRFAKRISLMTSLHPVPFAPLTVKARAQELGKQMLDTVAHHNATQKMGTQSSAKKVLRNAMLGFVQDPAVSSPASFLGAGAGRFAELHARPRELRERQGRRKGGDVAPLSRQHLPGLHEFPDEALGLQYSSLPYSPHAQLPAHFLLPLQHLVLDATPLATSIALDHLDALLQLIHADHKGPRASTRVGVVAGVLLGVLGRLCRAGEVWSEEGEVEGEGVGGRWRGREGAS